MNIDTARHVVETMEGNIRNLTMLLPILKKECDPEEFNEFKREIGRIMVNADQHFYPLILKQYPELNPLKEANRPKNG